MAYDIKEINRRKAKQVKNYSESTSSDKNRHYNALILKKDNKISVLIGNKTGLVALAVSVIREHFSSLQFAKVIEKEIPNFISDYITKSDLEISDNTNMELVKNMYQVRNFIFKNKMNEVMETTEDIFEKINKIAIADKWGVFDRRSILSFYNIPFEQTQKDSDDVEGFYNYVHKYYNDIYNQTVTQALDRYLTEQAEPDYESLETLISSLYTLYAEKNRTMLPIYAIEDIASYTMVEYLSQGEKKIVISGDKYDSVYYPHIFVQELEYDDNIVKNIGKNYKTLIEKTPDVRRVSDYESYVENNNNIRHYIHNYLVEKSSFYRKKIEGGRPSDLIWASIILDIIANTINSINSIEDVDYVPVYIANLYSGLQTIAPGVAITKRAYYAPSVFETTPDDPKYVVLENSIGDMDNIIYMDMTGDDKETEKYLDITLVVSEAPNSLTMIRPKSGIKEKPGEAEQDYTQKGVTSNSYSHGYSAINIGDVNINI